MSVYDFYSLSKSMYAGQQFACSRKKESDSLAAVRRIILALMSHASLNHTLCIHAFSVLPTLS